MGFQHDHREDERIFFNGDFNEADDFIPPAQDGDGEVLHVFFLRGLVALPEEAAPHFRRAGEDYGAEMAFSEQLFIQHGGSSRHGPRRLGQQGRDVVIVFSLRVACDAQEGLALLPLRLDVKHFKDEGAFIFGQGCGDGGTQEQAGGVEAFRRCAGAVRFFLPAVFSIQLVGEVFIFPAEGGVGFFVKSRTAVFQRAGLFLHLPVPVDQPLAFHVPHDESGAQDNQQDDFSRVGAFHGRPSDDGDHNDQDGLEQVCFFEEGGLFEHKKDAGERLVEKKVMLYKSC